MSIDPMSTQLRDALADYELQAIAAAVRAGEEILRVRERTYEVLAKDDKSPVTEADHAAHDIIHGALSPAGIPVLSEEGAELPSGTRTAWSRLWIVDPLDGTKGFIQGSDNFTVNIALVEANEPTFGVVYVPVSHKLFVGKPGAGAVRILLPEGEVDSDRIWDGALALPEQINAEGVSASAGPASGGPERAGVDNGGTAARPLRVVASKSHRNAETDAYIDYLGEVYGEIELVSESSSKKLCAIAEGSADIYPRLGRTMEWDIAAGDAVVRASGGAVLSVEDGIALRYNKRDLASPHFVALRAGLEVKHDVTGRPS